MQKPPVAPKPKLTQFQRPGLSPSTPRRDSLSLLSPGKPRRVKPVLAPKPCLSKLATTVESKPHTSKSQLQTSVTETLQIEGPLNSQNGLQQENKKPDWDYIIPICLCSQENCMCIRNTSANRKLLPASLGSVDNSGEKTDNAKCKVMNTSTNTNLTNHKPLQETFTLDRILNADINTSSPEVTVRPSLPHRTWSDEANGNVIPQSAPGRGPEEDALGSKQISCVPQPKTVPAASRKPIPVPVPQKPRAVVLARQEKVEEASEEIVGQDGREMKVKEVKVSSEGKGSSSLSVSVPVGNKMPIFLSARKAYAQPAPPLGKKPLLSAPAPQMLPKDVEEEDLGWDSSIQEMEVSVDKEDEEVEKEGTHDQEAVYSDFTHSPPSSSLLNQPALSEPPAPTVAAEDRVVKVVPKKPQRHSSPMAWMQRKESSEEKEEWNLGDDEKRQALPIQDCVLKGRVMKNLSLPPKEKTSKQLSTPGITKPFRSSKQRAKSFSAADLYRSEGQKRNSFRKLLDLKLSVKMLPKLILKGGQSSECTVNDNEQSVDRDQDGCQGFHKDLQAQRKFSCPLIGVEQSVDGDEFSPGTDQVVYYENIPYYEEIPDYINVHVGSALTSPCASISQPTAWQYNDEDIYEEQEPYMSFEKNTGHQQCQTSSVDEEMTPLDDDIFANTSEDEDDSSSISSKGDPEQPEESTDFRNAVSTASRQSGKPVIEEQVDLHLSDIFLKKGPYLKMYSTYIREFDKNVALLEEQSKKNPAFSAVVREFEVMSPCCANLALKHYLLKPVQRIPQYRMLLTDYLKNLSEDSDDYKDTQAALVIVKEVANHANNIMKQGDNFQKLIQVQCSLNGHHEIVQPGRIFLKEGILKKLSRKVMQPRMFFLFNDTLLYTTPVQSGQYKFNNMLSLAGMKVSKPSQEAYQNELNIESVERSFILSASSATERDEWLEAISTAISDYTRKKISFISELQDCGDGAPLGSKAPIWIPDPRTTMCMICTCEFTLTWRRHHCRACGKVVCQSCSSNKYCLEYLKNQLARVCDQCFPVLQQQKSERALSAAISPGTRATFAFPRKHKKIPAALKEVSASTDNSSMSGYLQRSKGNKKQGKRLWFVIKDKVLYTYAASEDVAALESQPLLGFMLKVDSSLKLQFKLYHKNTLYYIFKADDLQTAQRWIDSFKEATVL
uniref:FYVE, RhoGEF and PH domain containing 6 n=1 Tax=Sander lucioperca TaxID=283035 RepID=A0A8D0D1H1_SANLU